jgi:hypothetical protein
MEHRLAGETEVLGENLPQRYFRPSQNPTWPDPGLNPGRRGGKPATNALSYFFFFIYLVSEAIGTAATPGLLCQPRVIVKMIVEKEMECRLAGETEVLGENLPQRHFCPSQQNPTWPYPGLNPGRRDGKPATNRLSYGAALDDLPKLLEDVPLAVKARMWYLHDGVPAHSAVLCEVFSITLSCPMDRYKKTRCMASMSVRSESSGLLPVGTSKHPCVCNSCWQRSSTSHFRCLSDYPQLSRHLWTDAAVHDETCQGVHWNLTKNILSTYYRCTLSATTNKLNVSGHVFI